MDRYTPEQLRAGFEMYRDRELTVRAKSDDVARRLMTIPGIGPLIATAIEALAPPCETFRSGRDFAAWVGLTPVQRSTGGKERLGRTSRMMAVADAGKLMPPKSTWFEPKLADGLLSHVLD